MTLSDLQRLYKLSEPFLWSVHVSRKMQHNCITYEAIYDDRVSCFRYVLALDLEGVHDVKLHHPSSSVATSNQ